jgi:hypothetical protein
MVTAIPRLPFYTSLPCRTFLRSHSQPKPRRNLRSRYRDMMESIHPSSDRSGSSDRASYMTRRTRSSSTTSHTSLTNPTTPYQDSDNGRLGSRFSILKPTASRSQTPHVSIPKIMTLPSWLQDTIINLDASDPLRAVFPTLHGVSDPTLVDRSSENAPDYQIPRHGASQSFCSRSTPPIPSRARLPDSDTSSDEPQGFPAHNYPLYNNDFLLHVQPGSPITPTGAFPAASNYHPSPSALINVARAPDICAGFQATALPASSPNYILHDPVSPPAAAQRDVECDDIFRYDPYQADFITPVLPPFEPPGFERTTRVYFDSPIEDPINSDPLDPSDHDPFKLDPEEFKRLGFKWTPFDRKMGMEEGTTSGEPETSGEPPGAG